MKNKIEIYILSGLIVLLSLYIILRQDKNINYEIPKLTKFSIQDITKINYDGFELSKSDAWYLPSGYRASENEIDKILEDIVNIKIIDMISQAGDYKRFGLDDSKELIVSKNDKTLLKLLIGSASSTGNYTYIKLPESKEIYSLRGDISRTLSKSEDDLRDKTVLTLGNISEIVVTRTDQVITKTGDETTEISTSFNNLKASNFKELSRDNILISVAFIGSTSKSLIIYEAVDGEYPATSSDVDFSFTLPEWVVNKLINLK